MVLRLVLRFLLGPVDFCGDQDRPFIPAFFCIRSMDQSDWVFRQRRLVHRSGTACLWLDCIDAVIHIVEEIPAPRKNAPKLIYLAVASGAVSGFILMMVCLFCIQEVKKVIDAPGGLPFMELAQETVGQTGGAVLMALFIMNALRQEISIVSTTSRLTWGFARDGGFHFSRYLSHVDPVWKAPVRAIWFQGMLIALVGILFLFARQSSTLFSALAHCIDDSYSLPIAVVLLVGREKLPTGGQFKLGKFGLPANWVSLIYCSVRQCSSSFRMIPILLAVI